MTIPPDWRNTAIANSATSADVEQRVGGRLHQIMAVSWLVMWLSNLMGFFSKLLSVNLYYPVIAVFLLYFAVSRPLDMARATLRPLMFAWAMTAVLPVAMYLNAPSHAFAYLSMRNRIVYFSVVAGTTVLLQDRNARITVRTAGLLALLIAIPLDLLELVVPNILSTAPGRSAGLHINPNLAASALIIALLLAIDFSRHRRRDVILVFFTYLAVITTFSRSGMLFATFVVAAYIFLPKGVETLTGGQRISLLAGGVAVIAIAAVAVLQLIDIDPAAYGRVQSILTSNYGDDSAQGRLEKARWALDQFLGNFWTGRGLGSPEYYALSTHNTFLAVAVEFGIAGLLLYVLLLFHGLFKVVMYGRQVAVNISLLALYLLFFSAFNHQVHNYATYAIGFSVLLTDALVRKDDDRVSVTSPGAPRLDAL